MISKHFLSYCGIVLTFVLLVANLNAVTVSWTNINGGSWSVPANWDTHFVPRSFDNVSILAPGTYTVLIDTNTTTTSIALGGASGTQTLTNAFQTVMSTNVLVAPNGRLSLGGGSFSGVNLTNQGLVTFAGGIIGIPITVDALATLNFSGSCTVVSPLTNFGTIHWFTNSASITIYNNHANYSCGVFNRPGALFDVQNDQPFYCGCYGFEFFNNAGTFRKSAGVGTTGINVTFTNTGTVDAQSGTIQFTAGGNLGGSYNPASNTIIQFTGGNFVQTSPVTNTGSGLFRQYGAAVTLNERITKFILVSGNVSLSPTFQGSGAIQNLQLDGAYLVGTNRVTGTLGFNGGGLGSASPLTVLGGGVLQFNGAAVNIYSPLTNSGSVYWSGTSVTLANNAAVYTGAFYNQPNGFLYLQSDQTFYSAGYGLEWFSNAGVVRKIAGLGTSSFNLPFTNSGTVDAQSGLIRFSSGGNISGSYNTGPGAIISFDSGSFVQSGSPSITGSGLCRQYGATVTLQDRILSFVLASGNVGLSPTFQTNGMIYNLQLDGAFLTGTNRVAGSLGFNGGGLASASPLTINASGVLNFNGASANIYAPLTNLGTINWSGTGLNIANNGALYTGAIHNQAGANFFMLNDVAISSAGYGLEFVRNLGTIRKTAGLGGSAISCSFTNFGTLDSQSGIIRVNASGNIGGIYNAAAGALVEFTSGNYLYSGNATVTGAGICRQNGANITLNDRIANFLHIAGNVSLTPAFQTNGTIKNLQLDGAYLVGSNYVTGTLGFNGGGLGSASPLTVGPSGNLYFNGAGVNVYSPITNQGAIIWSGNGGLSIANNAAAYTGAIYNQPNGTVQLLTDQNMTSVGYGFEMFNNSGTIRKSGGLATSAISVPFVNSGAIDAQSGIFRIAGPYTQTAGTMNLGISSLALFGQIAFSSLAPLTGTLSVNFNTPYYPSAGDSFPLLTWATRSGIFTNLNLPALAQWQTNYTANNFTLSVLSVTGGSTPVTLTPVSFAPGGFTLRATGPIGPSYILQASTNYTTWVSLLTNTPSSMPVTFVDPGATAFKSRFYRVLLGN